MSSRETVREILSKEGWPRGLQRRWAREYQGTWFDFCQIPWLTENSLKVREWKKEAGFHSIRLMAARP